MPAATDRLCLSCGDPIPRGKGRSAVYCRNCLHDRRQAQMAIRSQRFALTQMLELVEAIGPAIYRWRKEVMDRQDGRCLTCSRVRRLYLAARDDGLLYGLCFDCFDDWVRAKRGRHDG